MQQTWTAPRFDEINLGSEIGTYYEDEGEPSFLADRAGKRVPAAIADTAHADEACA